MRISKNLFLCLIASATAFLTGCGSKVTTPQENTVTNYTKIYVTNNITTIYTNTVTNEVIKTIPAEIPYDYLVGYNILTNMETALPITMEDCLKGMTNISVEYSFADPIKLTILEEDAKAKFELSLRKNGVTIDPNSLHVLILTINGFYSNDGNTLCYAIQLSVVEKKLMVINGMWRQKVVELWTKGDSFGTVGKEKASDAMMNEVESESEIFANEYLKANPK